MASAAIGSVLVLAASASANSIAVSNGHWKYTGGTGNDFLQVNFQGAGTVEDPAYVVFVESNADTWASSPAQCIPSQTFQGSKVTHCPQEGSVVEIHTAEGIDNVRSSTEDDAVVLPLDIHGGPGDDNLSGNTAADTIDGGDGDDRLQGENALEAGSGNDHLIGGPGRDEAVIEEHTTGAVVATLGLSGAPGTSQGPSTGTDTLAADIEDIFCHCFGSSTLTGNEGDNALEGSHSAGPLTIVGLGGNDSLVGAKAGDHLDGGPGDDELDGDLGVDVFSGGDGADILYADYGDPGDELHCGAGIDQAHADPGDSVDADCDGLNPNVVFDEGPSGPGNPATATFAFHSAAAPVTFECKLDTAAFAACVSPRRLEDLALGSHTFTVVAIDDQGRRSNPEARTWEVGAYDCSSSIKVGFARACGVSLVETAPDSKIYKTADKAWVGGFELRPRPSGKLVVDVPAKTLRAEGTGVDVVFAGSVVPFDVFAIPVGVAAADLDFNQAGTIEKQLFKLPIAGSAKVAWADDGASAKFEAEIELDKLTGIFATFDSGLGGGKLTAQLRNGTGFELTSAELKIPEISATPKNLTTPRALKLKEILFKYELLEGKHAWEGGATFAVPVAKSTLELTGRGRVYDGSLAGASIKVAGFNKPIPDTPLYVQAIEGSLVFNPKWGYDLGVEATLGPVVAEQKIIRFNGNLRGGALTAGCPSALDPIEVTLKGDIPALKELGAGSAKVEGTSCLSSNSLAMQTKMKIEAALGPDSENEALVGLKGELTGWISRDGLSMTGTSTLRLPTFPELSGTNLLSTKGIVACAEFGLFAGGVAYPWGGVPQAFTGCDLAPWQVPGSASSADASAAASTGRVTVARGLPFVGFSAAGARRPPRLRILGPRGESFTSPANRRGRRSRAVVFAPVPSENRTYVFVRRPAAGRWRVVGLDGPIKRIRSARGLADPKVTVKIERVKGAKAKRRLVYRIRSIPGQKVRFYDRADNVVRPIGRATSRRRGKTVFTPGKSSDRSHTIEAVVTSGRFPRAVLTVARFRL